ncbi:MAG: hypothetical protein R3Y35_14830 [Clostridia bacterium]
MNKKKQKSSKDLIGIEEITEHSICTKFGEIIYFMIKPSNLSVLSESSIAAKVNSFKNALQGIESVEMLCLNSKENFDENKAFIKKRIQEEDNKVVRTLLEKDSVNMDKLQVTMATSREFLIAVRILGDKDNELTQYISSVEKSFKKFGIIVKVVNNEDIKRILSVYFEQNVTTEKYEDYDGELSLLRRDGTECQRGYGERWII